MRLLVITHNSNRASFRQRIGAYLDTFAQQGIATEVALLPEGLLARRRLFRQARDFDGVLLHKKKLNRHDAWCLRRNSRKVIYNFDDAIMYSSARPGVYSRAHAIPFRRTVQLADLVIAGSAYLADEARPFNRNVCVLPLGLNLQDYGLEPLPPADGVTRLVWIGSDTTLKYLDRIRPALERVVAAHKNVMVRLIGDTFPTWPGIPTEQIKWSAQARRVGLATSDIGLAPLPDDAFTRGKCSFKVLEYSASSLPVVASPVGTNADYVRPAVTGFLAVTEDDWAEHLGRLIMDPSLRKRMGAQGRTHAAQYDVSVIGDRFSDLVRRCLEGKDR
ncbi:MAG TPA: glycosyltransferase family 4 protein [Myxococcota bacterium]|jgi:glycosyltransferase involved in cell wall biosynthesis|nr:glycosyltransferase family 4 protein [Myxococcota bacterium]